MTGGVIELAPQESLASGLGASDWDYRDRYSIQTEAGQYDTVDEVVTDWFKKQPTWLRVLSTNSLSRRSVEESVANGFRVGSKVGTWEVVDRDDNEVVFSDSMGFMEYRFSFLLSQQEQDSVEASTAVRYLWRRTGRFYFALVKPMHRRFVKLLLARTVE